MSVDLDVDEWEVERPAGEDRLAIAEAKIAELARLLQAKQKADEPRPPKFPTLPAFVTHLMSWYRRDAESVTWCPEWFLHPEAVIRFRAVWRAFETMRDPDPDQDDGDGTWESAWLRDHVDVHLSKLLAGDGPFGSCSAAEGHRFPLEPLPCTAPPDEWWTEADTGL
jgi:hypothetical protein